MDPLIGRTLGEFVVGERLGQGGFGTVYRAEQQLLRRQAVIKVLNLAHRGKEVIIKRFFREAQLASQLDHPYGAHIYSFGAEPDGLLWIAMELVRGSSLDKLAAAQGPMSLERFAPLLQRLCEVVHAAHERGIVHRDIKPANVMVLARSGTLLPKLLDFGIAKLVDEEVAPLDDPLGQGNASKPEPTDEALLSTVDKRLTQGGAIVGSPHYMAPELWLNKGVGPAADVYALTVLTYELISGRHPFDGQSQLQIARAHARQPAPPLGGDLPIELDEVMRRGLAKRPGDRFASAMDLAHAFHVASGLTQGSVELPQLDETVRSAVLADAPQGLAESVAALDAVRSIHQAKDALQVAVRIAIRHVGLYALAARSRIGAPPGGDSQEARDLLRALRRRGLGEREWVALARELVRPHAGRADVTPLPELVTLFFDDRGLERDPFAPILAIGDDTTDSAVTEAAGRAFLDKAIPCLGSLLRQLAFLCAYPIVAAAPDRAGRVERFTGVRRQARISVELGSPPPAGDVVLLDERASPVLKLSPLFCAATPTPGAPAELFMFDGPARGARFTAPPTGFQRTDDKLWEWFRTELLADEGGASGSDDSRSPYLGLNTFSTEDAGFFVGREREIDSFVNRMRLHPFLTLVGPSGAGKSSFVHAGVIASLSPRPIVVTTRPGPAPLAALQSHLEHAGIDAEGLREALAHDREALGRIARAFSSGRGEPVLLIVDQFEELFTLGASSEERAIYAEALCRAVRTADDPLRIVITLRDDFLTRAQEIGDLRERLREGLELLVSPSADDLLRILVEPARRAGYAFEDTALPREMVESIAGQPGALPLLSFAAAQLWEVRDRHFKQLPRRAYEALGGVGGALATYAESMLGSLNKDDQRLVRHAFRHLVTADGTRAALRRKELIELLRPSPSAEAIVERLIASRLVVASEDDLTDRVEIAHEALIVAWPRLAEWRREDAEGARMRDQLRAAARQWEERGRARGLLWRDEALTELRLWRARSQAQLTHSEDSFMSQSLVLAARGRLLRNTLVVAIFAALSGVLAIVLVLNHRTELERRRTYDQLALNHEEQGRVLLQQGEPMKALVYLAEARKMGRDGAGLRHLLGRATAPFEGERLVLQGLKGCAGVRVSPDGHSLLGLGLDGRSLIWNLDTGERVAELTGHGATVLGGTWPSSGLVWTTSYDHTAKLYEAATGRLIATASAGRELLGVTESPDGQTVATFGMDGVVRLLDARTGALRRALPALPAPVADVAFDPRGRTLAVGDWDHVVRLFDLVKPDRAPVELRGHTLAVTRIAYAPDGLHLASGAKDGMVRIYDPAAQHTVVLDHSGDAIAYFTFSGDGQRVLTVAGGRARVFESRTGKVLLTLQAPRDSLTAAAFDGTGRRVVTGGADGSLRLWDASDGRQLGEFVGHLSPIQEVAVRAGDGQVVSGSVDGVVRTWVLPARDASAIARTDGAVWSAALTADGAHLVAISQQGEVTQRRAADLALEHRFSIAGLGATPFVSFSRDGAALLAAKGSGVQIWNLAGEVQETLEAEGQVSALAAYLPERRVVVGRQDGAVEWWELAPPRRIAVSAMEGLGAGPVIWLRYDRDGRRLLIGRDRVMTVWDVQSRRMIVSLAQHDGMVNSADFSPDGTRVATASDDRKARVWRLTGGEPVIAVDADALAISVAFDARGELLVVGTDSGQIGWWDIASGRQVGALAAHKGFVSYLEWRDGRVYSGAADGRLGAWPAFSSPVNAARVDSLMDCRVGYALQAGILVPRTLPACAQVAQNSRQ